MRISDWSSDVCSSDLSAQRLLTVATLIPRKGQDLLVEALARLADRPWSLDLVGDARHPGYAAVLERRIAALGLERRIARHGAVAHGDLDRFWRAADLFVLPSRHEGWGIASDRKTTRLNSSHQCASRMPIFA